MEKERMKELEEMTARDIEQASNQMIEELEAAPVTIALTPEHFQNVLASMDQIDTLRARQTELMNQLRKTLLLQLLIGTNVRNVQAFSNTFGNSLTVEWREGKEEREESDWRTVTYSQHSVARQIYGSGGGGEEFDTHYREKVRALFRLFPRR